MTTCPEQVGLPANDQAPGEHRRPRSVSWRTALIPAGGHGVPVRVLTPAQPSGWLVWAHGGSWGGGSAEQWHGPCADLAARSSVVVVSVDYRLAPRHPYPAPVDDVLTAMAWARKQMVMAGAAPTLLGVGGDSAGGTLAACAALAWRDRGLPLAAQVLAYPPFDPSCRATSYATPGQFPARSVLRAAWDAHLGTRGTSSSRAASYPSFVDAERLQGVAPAILAVGDLDPVRDDVWAYARRLRRVDVPVAAREFADTPHGAFLRADPHPPDSPDQREPTLRAWLASTLRDHLDRPAHTDGDVAPIGAP